MDCPNCGYKLPDLDPEALAEFKKWFNRHTNATGAGPAGPPPVPKEKK
jgi:hypothetical protein